MRRLLSIVITWCAVLGVSAQDSTNMFRFGYLSYETALQSMPEYTTVQQELMEKNIAFKEKSLAELAKAEKDMMAPLKIRLIETLGKIGRERGYAFIIDTDAKALPFINPDMGEDINQLVRNALQ